MSKRHSPAYRKAIDPQNIHWTQLRWARYRLQGGRCAVCHLPLGFNWELHHLHYRTIGSETVNDVRWWECDKVRFLSGFPQKIGGWVKYTPTAFLGVCRQLFNWVTTFTDNFLALGTNLKVYIEQGGNFYDITPARATFSTPDTDDCLTFTYGSDLVVVAIDGHGGNDGDYVTFSGIAAGSTPGLSEGGIPLVELETSQPITVINANAFSITVATPAVFGDGWSIQADIKLYGASNNGAFPLAGNPGAAFENPYVLAQNLLATMKDQTSNASVAIRHKGEKTDLTIQSSRQRNYRYYTNSLDADFSPADIVGIFNNYGRDFNNVNVVTNEVRLSSSKQKDSKFSWTIGAYHFIQDNPTKQATAFGKDAGLFGVPDTVLLS